MKPPCEIIVRTILPHVRALVSIELKKEYKFSGKEIAQLVGTTEAAVSQYLHGVRGAQEREQFTIDYPELQTFSRSVSRELYEKRETGIELTEKLGDMCAALRHNENFVALYSEGSERAACGICFKAID